MVTNEQLRKEVARLRAEKKRSMTVAVRNKKQVIKERNEKRKLMEELRDLQNPRTAAFKSNVKRGLRRGGKGASAGLKRFWDNLPEN